MNKNLLHIASQFSEKEKKTRQRKRVFSLLSIAVVFFTLNALMLPAITMEKQTICGNVEHIHSDKCYSDVTTPEYLALSEYHQHGKECYVDGILSCNNLSTCLHRHNEYCYDSTGVLVCPLEEITGHIHSEECYELQKNLICELAEDYHIHDDSCFVTENGELICPVEETEGHLHTDGCYHIISTDLICQTEETEGHIHSEECYRISTENICQLVETEGHKHTEQCKSIENILNCEIAEDENHTHNEECYTANEILICTLEETEPHTHTEQCTRQFKELVCEKEEIPAHTHSTECYQDNKELICGNEEIQPHTHNTECYRQIKTVICEKEEKPDGHTHTERCYEETKNLICTEKEIILHSHTAECYGENGELTCGLEEVKEHIHSENCTTFVQTEPILVCEVEEHQHTERCYPQEEYNVKELICSCEEHIHTEECGENCDKQEHTHTEQCYGSEEQPADMVQLIHQGEDYTVTVKYSRQAEIPENAVLTVREILPDSDEYRQYLMDSQSVIETSDGDELQTEITFARFFDISFLVDEEKFEPLAPVEISITYTDAVEFARDSTASAVHFAQNGVEVLEAYTNETENKADTFTFTQDSFSVTGTVVTVQRAAAENMDQYVTLVEFLNSSGAASSMFKDGDTVTIKISGKIDAWRYGNAGGADKPVYISVPQALSVSSVTPEGSLEDVVINGNTITVTVPAEPANGYYNDVYFVLKINCTAVNKGNSVINVNLKNTNCNIYSSLQQFTYTMPDGAVRTLETASSNYPESEYMLVVERTDSSIFESNVKSNLSSLYPRRTYIDSAAYNIYLQKKTDSNVKVDIPAPYSLNIQFPYSPITYSKIGLGVVYNLNNGNVTMPTAQSVTAMDNLISGISISDSYTSLKRFGIASLGGEEYNGNFNLKYNYQIDAFITDPAYSKYYNDNSPIGTAGSFHIVAFDTANLNTHTNGNVLAKNLNAGSNFGTNGYDDELTYVQNYLKVNSGSASDSNHTLVVGSSNNITPYDNGNRYQINNTAVDRPKNVVQDADTNNTPFIDLVRVKTEILQISANLRKNKDTNITQTSSGDKAVFSLTKPDSVGIINVKYNDSKIFGRNIIQLSGFQSDHEGSIVINVDCTGATEINMPQAYVVIDGVQQGTNEVVEFSAGKVLWNFINAEGVTINTHLMTGMIIAPGATVNINQNLNGTVVADTVNVKAESHRTDFTGRIVPGEDVEDDIPTTTHITIQKSRTGYVGLVLADARFDLYVWNNNVWQKIDKSDIITNENGLVTVTGIKKDTAYRLVETQAPPGYILSEKPIDFWVRSAKNVISPSRRPSDFSGRTLDAGNVMNIPNNPDTSFETTSITVEKQWVAENTRLPDSITIDVYQIVMSAGRELSREAYKTITLTASDNWKITLTDLPKSGKDAEGNQVTYLYSVSEQIVANFTAGYSDNNTRGIDTGSVIITNTEITGSYELPETGGIGKNIYTTGGLLLILSATLLLCYRKNRYRKEDNTSF